MRRVCACAVALLLIAAPWAIHASAQNVVPAAATNATGASTVSNASLANTELNTANTKTTKLGGICADFFSGCAAAIDAFCTSPLGVFLHKLTDPFTMMTGGLISNDIPPTASQLASPGAVGSAAKIKQDAANSKARVAAVQYLGTVDCHYYPEAEVSLIGSLRADPIECVRLAAAEALGSGCCCNKKTIEALTITVSGSARDGNPSETSLRVRIAAYNALQRCVSSYCGSGAAEAESSVMPRPEVPQSPEMVPGPSGQSPVESSAAIANASGIQLTAYYEHVEQRPKREIVLEAQQVLAVVRTHFETPRPVVNRPPRDLFSLWRNSKREEPKTAKRDESLELVSQSSPDQPPLRPILTSPPLQPVPQSSIIPPPR